MWVPVIAWHVPVLKRMFYDDAEGIEQRRRLVQYNGQRERK